MHIYFTLGAYYQLHFWQFYHGSILYGPWLGCFHQQTELGPYWVTLSGGIRDIAWKQILKWNKLLYNDNQYIHVPVWKLLTRRKATHDHCAIALGLPQDDRPMSVRFYGPCKGIVRRPCGLPTTIARVYDHFFGPKWQSKTLRCPHDHRAVPVRWSYDVTAMCLRATGLRFFSNLSLCGVKQNRRGHDARRSVRWSQGLPAEAARKRWFGHRTGIVYSS